MTDARPPADPHKKKVTFSQWDVTACQDVFCEGWLNCLFLCRRDNSTAGSNCSRQPAVSASSAAAHPPKLIFNVSLPLLNNENRNEVLNGKLGNRGAFRVTRFQLRSYYHLHTLFCTKVKSEFHFFLFFSLPHSHSLLSNVCVHMCASARVLKHHEGIGPLPPLLLTNVKG